MNNFLIVSPQNKALKYAEALAEKLEYHVLLLEDYIEYFMGTTVERMLEINGKDYFAQQMRKAVKSLEDFQETVCLCGLLPFVEEDIFENMTTFDVVFEGVNQNSIDEAIESLIEKYPSFLIGKKGKLRENIKKTKRKNDVKLLKL